MEIGDAATAAIGAVVIGTAFTGAAITVGGEFNAAVGPTAGAIIAMPVATLGGRRCGATYVACSVA